MTNGKPTDEKAFPDAKARGGAVLSVVMKPLVLPGCQAIGTALFGSTKNHQLAEDARDMTSAKPFSRCKAYLEMDKAFQQVKAHRGASGALMRKQFIMHLSRIFLAGLYTIVEPHVVVSSVPAATG